MVKSATVDHQGGDASGASGLTQSACIAHVQLNRPDERNALNDEIKPLTP